jgi:hypothetical protein
MRTLLLKTMLIVGLIGARGVVSAQTGEPQGSAALSDRPEPCYVVIAVDVSGSMESSDSFESGGKRQTFRDEGQLVFLQMLPYLRSDLYVGVAHFSDRVRYSLPSEDTGPLLPWGQTFLTESACRNMVRTAEFMATFRTDIGESLNWASGRIAAARRQYGQGSAKLIVLTNGAPRDSARELERGRGPLQSMAKRFAEQQIQLYPILINAASLRSSDRQSRLSADELAAEDLMQSVALTTGGKAYRLSRDRGFADILLDVFGLGVQIQSSDSMDPAQASNLLVSGHDWAIVAVGEPVKSATVDPIGGAGAGRQALTIDGSLEAGTGIRANVITSSGQQATLLRRPEAADYVARFWQGKWTLGPADAKSSPAVRLYRIPDLLVQVELEPALPWWRYEQVKARAHLLERHKKGPDLRAAPLSESGQDLSVHMKAVSVDERDSVAVDRGRWTSSRVYETDPFAIETSGLYKLTCDLRHTVGDANLPLLRLASDVYVHSECVGVQVVNAATNEVLGEVPSAADATLPVELSGGQDVYFRVYAKGEFKVEPQSGGFHLEPLSQSDWPLRKDDQGNLVTGAVPLVEGEERLVGRAELEVRTQAGVRRIHLPRFHLAYPPAPLRIECRFTDTRDALWVGEYHKQPLVVSAFPVFDSFREATLKRFPDAFAETRTRTVDMQSGTTQVTTLQSRVLNPAQPGPDRGRTIAATYFLESAIPIPAADRCEIDLGTTMEGLQGAAKTYAIVDPVAQGLFKWGATQPGQSVRQGAVSETLFCGEPIQFHAEWRADQNISAVRFEFPQTDSNEPVFVDMPMTAGTNRTDLEQVVTGLSLGRTLPLYVHVTMQPTGGDRAVQIKLRGGQFRADDRRVVLEDLRVGEGGPTDITAYAWEPIEIPLRVVFTGYVAANAQHNAAIEQFKKSCVVNVVSRTGDSRDVSNTIEWTSVSSPEGPAKRCELIGHATYTPNIPGRASIEAMADTPAVQGAGEASPRRAYAHLLAKAPRLAVTIRKLTPTGEEPVFDSRRWSAGEGGVSGLQTRFSARLRVDIRSSDWAATGQSRPWRAAIRLLRRPSPDAEWVSEFSDANELTGDGRFLREVQIAGNGEYALEVSGVDLQSGRRTAFFVTPVIASIRPHEIKPTVAPPAWLTSRVRQWPFEYQVTLPQEAAEASQSQALAFQFQLPGQMQTWMDGTAASIPSQTPEARQLLVKGPRFLPAAQGLQNGMVQFRLSCQGLDMLRWDCPDIRVMPPVFDQMSLSGRSNGDAIALAGAELVSDGSSELWVRPRFRAAPELEGQWTPAESTVYLWRCRAGESAGGQADVRFLEALQEQGGSNVETFRIESPAEGGAVKVMPRRARLRILGWPQRPASERYSLLASVVYRPSGDRSADRMIAEWSDVYAVQLNTPWVVPLIWWPVIAILVAGIVTTILRLFVPSPSRLPLDMRLEENIAVVEPVRLDNPVLVDLQETSLVKDVQLTTRHLRSQWNGSVLAFIAGPVRVLLRRALYPRRWAWTAVIPRVRADARSVRTGLMCVWTGLGARRGRVWSQRDGSQRLPEDGQVKMVHMDLPYRVDNVSRTMRVTIRIGKLMHRELL